MSQARLISNSGGSTSAFMTFRELQNGLSKHDFIVFANTGKEREETLEFLHNQERLWGIKIHWIEYHRINKWKAVNFETASRKGEPFEQLIYKKSYLPNVVTRFCTQELKIRPMRDFMRSQGFNTWTNLVGIRYDEPQRYSNQEASERKQRWYNDFPLYYDGIIKADVNSFWRQQPFKLNLLPHEGNCDLCFLKGKNKRKAILRDNPSRAEWWIEMENITGASFDKTATVQQILHSVNGEINYNFTEPEYQCFCGE